MLPVAKKGEEMVRDKPLFSEVTHLEFKHYVLKN